MKHCQVRIDFPAINRAALPYLPELCARWLPDGRRRGREWVARNPRRADRHAGSFSVNLENGRWADFAAGAGGGDVVSLAAYLAGISQAEAARQLAGMLGVRNHTDASMFDQLTPRPHRNGLAVAQEVLHWVSTIPDGVPEPPGLRGSARYWYRDAGGQPSYAVDRHEPRHDGERKQFFPCTLWRNEAGELVWRRKHPPAPRPLYRRNHLAQRRPEKVLVVEGEKTAAAAGNRFRDLLVTTSSGGSEAADKTDWSPVAGREVVVWPDNDEPGARYAADVARLAHAAGAASVSIVAVPTEWPEGWDPADELPRDVTVETVREMIAAATPTSQPYSPAMNLPGAGENERQPARRLERRGTSLCRSKGARFRSSRPTCLAAGWATTQRRSRRSRRRPSNSRRL